jgi:hypothetical protein
MSENEYPTGRCEGCGEIVQADHGTSDGSGYGHTVTRHAAGCDGYTCAPDCPWPDSCGPIIPHRTRSER